MSEPASFAPSTILETALYVSDLDEAIRFYRDIIGLELHQHVQKRHAFFRIGSAMLLLFDPAETQKPSTNPHLPVPPHGATGPGHICFSMARAEMGILKTRLVEHGVHIEAEFEWPNGAKSVYFRDPAGNSLELAEPWLWQ